MTRYDFEIALLAWIASIVAVAFLPQMLFVIVATTVNLWHQRNTAYHAGEEFVARVRKVIYADLDAFEERIRKVEKSNVDMTETHRQMASTFTGTRNLPR